MIQELIAKTTIEIKAPVSEVWKALTTPELIKQYFFGTETVSDWKVGSPITFKGTWEGKAYEDKGTILNIEPHKFLKFNYWSSFSGTEDIPENYANITYELSEKDESTILSITQNNIRNEELRDHSEQNWRTVLNNLKNLLENKL